MKKAIVPALFLLLALTVSAREIKGMFGINWSKYLFSSEITDMNWRNRTGFQIGLGWAFDLKPKMQLEVEALFSEKGAKAELAYAPGKSVSGNYRNTSLGIPILFKYKLKEGASPYAALGPEFIFILGHNLKIAGSEGSFNLSEYTKKIIFAFDALLGYSLPVGQWTLFAELRYSRWFTDLLVYPEAAAKSESLAILLGGALSL